MLTYLDAPALSPIDFDIWSPLLSRFLCQYRQQINPAQTFYVLFHESSPIRRAWSPCCWLPPFPRIPLFCFPRILFSLILILCCFLGRLLHVVNARNKISNSFLLIRFGLAYIATRISWQGSRSRLRSFFRSIKIRRFGSPSFISQSS